MMFAPDVEEAIAFYAKEEGLSREEALARLVRDWLIGQGLLEFSLEDEIDDCGHFRAVTSA